MDKWWKKYLIIVILLIFFVFLLKYLFIYFTPFVLAIIFASLIDPIVGWIEKKTVLNRGFSVILVLILSLSLIVILVIFGVSQIYLELNRALQNLPDYNTLNNQFQWLFEQNYQLQQFIDELEISPAIKNVLDTNLEMIYDALKNGLVKLINGVMGYFTKLPMFLTILFLSFIATFFISRDKTKLNGFLLNIFPPHWRGQIGEVKGDLMSSANGFIRAQIILITMTGIITGIGLSIIGSQYALILGITAAVLDLIPIIGPALIFYPWILYNIILGNVTSAISLFVLHIILAAVRSGSEGKIMGENLGIYPLSTMIALYVGFRVMGIIGFIIGPAVLVLIKAIIQADLINFDKR